MSSTERLVRIRRLLAGLPGPYGIGQLWTVIRHADTDVFRTLVKLLGNGSRWWTNTDLGSWDPVTRDVMDALVFGMGGGVMVSVLATDEN